VYHQVPTCGRTSGACALAPALCAGCARSTRFAFELPGQAPSLSLPEHAALRAEPAALISSAASVAESVCSVSSLGSLPELDAFRTEQLQHGQQPFAPFDAQSVVSFPSTASTVSLPFGLASATSSVSAGVSVAGFSGSVASERDEAVRPCLGTHLIADGEHSRFTDKT
jgi:hypothetical protein